MPGRGGQPGVLHPGRGRALPRSGPATPGASGHGIRPALALRRHPPLRRLAAGAK
ncbi:hypothetical protein, partial [Pseudomonas aeruginosa]|uniref:hypothetical protein n=1 Tax=Pseudomonas aeruginosa TaxID=287 RepID=UPI003C6DC43A